MVNTLINPIGLIFCNLNNFLNNFDSEKVFAWQLYLALWLDYIGSSFLDKDHNHIAMGKFKPIIKHK